MSVVTTSARIAAMAQLIPGITVAFPSIPRVVQDAELPAVVVFPGEATYDVDTFGDNDVVETRLYRVLFLIQKAAYGTEDQAQVAIEPFFNTIRDYFLARPGLELTGATLPQTVVYNSTMIGDSGYQIIGYPDQQSSYAAIEYRLSVIEFAEVNYAD